MRFAVDLTALLWGRHYTLTDTYDIVAFPHSGYPTAASYLLSRQRLGFPMAPRPWAEAVSAKMVADKLVEAA